MKPFLTLDESSIDSTLIAASREGYFRREAARAVAFDSQGAVALLHVTRDGYYKLPGGGIEAGEDPLEALERELLEEIGCHAQVTHHIGTVLEQRYYQDMTQISHCYVAQVIGDKGQPDYTDKEREAGFEIVWVRDIREAITLLESSAAAAAQDVNTAFMTLRDTAITQRAMTFINQ